MKVLLRNILLFLFALACFGNANGQERNYMYYSGGYNFSKPDMDGLNFVIDRYNENRPDQVRKLDNIDWMHGFTVGGGLIIAQSFLVEVGFTQRESNGYAEGYLVNNPNLHQFDLRTNISTIGLGVGKYLLWEKGFKLVAGSHFELGSTKVLWRLYDTTVEAKPGYENAKERATLDGDNPLFAITPYLQFSYSPWGEEFEIALKPYYQFEMNESDFRFVNQVFNSFSYEQDSPESTKSRSNNYGVQLKMNVFVKINL